MNLLLWITTPFVLALIVAAIAHFFSERYTKIGPQFFIVKRPSRPFSSLSMLASPYFIIARQDCMFRDSFVARDSNFDCIADEIEVTVDGASRTLKREECFDRFRKQFLAGDRLLHDTSSFFSDKLDYLYKEAGLERRAGTI